jgi:hypothetical protein
MNIYQRLNEVRKAVGYAQKDKRVEGQGYMAVTHDAITAAVREHFVTHGVIVVPSLVASQVVDTTTKTGKGIPIIRYEATYDVTFQNIDETADKVVVRIESHALDQGDKAPGKAISYAVKYAMLKLLSIETGEEDEGRIEQKPDTRPASTKSIGKADFDALTKDRQNAVLDASTLIGTFVDEQRPYDAHEVFVGFELIEEKTALWKLLGKPQQDVIREQMKKAKEPESP